MRPIVRAIGKVLRLVGISSPEDAIQKAPSDANLPSWRTPSQPPAKREKSSD